MFKKTKPLPKAVKKLPGQKVKVATTKIDDPIKIKLYQQAAMDAIVRELPDKVRAGWNGEFDYQYISESRSYRTRITLTKVRGSKDDEIVYQSLFTTEDDNEFITYLADHAGVELSKWIKEHYDNPPDPKLGPTGKHLEQNVDRARQYLETQRETEMRELREERKQQRKAAELKKKSDACPLCGETDDDTYGEWGPCPHAQ